MARPLPDIASSGQGCWRGSLERTSCDSTKCLDEICGSERDCFADEARERHGVQGSRVVEDLPGGGRSGP